MNKYIVKVNAVVTREIPADSFQQALELAQELPITVKDCVEKDCSKFEVEEI